MHVYTHSCVRVQDDLKDKRMKDMMFAMTAFDTDEPQRLNQSSNLSVQANDESCGKMKGDYTHCNTLQHTATHCNTLQHSVQHTATQCATHSHSV